jgi:hypothetical protein
MRGARWVGIGGLPGRAQIAVLVLLVFAAVTAQRWARFTVAASRLPAVDEIGAYELRYDALREALAGETIVGYVGEPITAEMDRAESRNQYRRYILTQYALAPIVVMRNAEPEVVVGDFATPESAAALPPADLVPVLDFGGGVVLFLRGVP